MFHLIHIAYDLNSIRILFFKLDSNILIVFLTLYSFNKERT